MGALFAMLAWLAAAPSAVAQGTFVSPDGAASVTITREGEATLTSGARVHAIAPMAQGPSLAPAVGVRLGGRFQRAYWSDDSSLVAIVGRCRGYSGVTVPRVPSCADKFVRVVSVARPEDARSLPVPWHMANDAMEVRALGFAADGSRLAAIVRADWSDCSYEGSITRLYVWSIGDAPVGDEDAPSSLAWQRIVPLGAHGPVLFEGDAVRIRAGIRSRLVRAPGRAGAQGHSRMRA